MGYRASNRDRAISHHTHHIMKLLYCTICMDVVTLCLEKRSCFCGRSRGVYTDRINATIKGPCVPLGISNSSLMEAIREQPEEGNGAEFVAFVIPKKCYTVIHKQGN